MRKSIIVPALCLASVVSAHAQAINVTTTGVGIGTTTPSSILDVKGAFTVRDAGGNIKLLTGSSVTVVADAGNPVNVYAETVGNSNFGLKVSHSGLIGFCGYLTTGAYGGLSQDGDKGIIFSNGPIDTGTFIIAPWGTSSAGIKIKSNGNVGINTSSTPERLTVNGKVKSKGFITDTTNWSDYVFAPDYRLTSLEEVEAHIKEKKHLPGIPSESELVEKGLDLGAMSAAQMAQIEQLMLHVIEMNKKLKAQGEEIQQLKAAMGAKGSLGTGVNGKL